MLPLSWDSWVPLALAAVLGYLLQRDAKTLLERFCRFDEAEPTPDKGYKPDVKLRGLDRLLSVYLIAVLAWYVSYLLGTHLVRTNAVWAGVGGADAERAISFWAVVASGVAFLAYLAGRWFFFHQRSAILRGRRVKGHKDARKALSRYREPAEPEITWGGVALPWSSGPRHFLAAGMTGSGKTNLLLQFMASVLVWIGKKPDQRALVYDPKTELFSFLYGLGLEPKVRILHPLDRRGCAWDLAADVTSPTTAQQMAAVLIPEDKDSKQPFFTMAAQQLLAGAFIFLMKSAPGNWDFRDAILLMERRELLHQALERYPETAGLIEEYFQHNDCFADVRATMANWLRRYRPIAACWHHAAQKVSLEDWMKKDYILLLGQDDSIRVQMDAINRAMLLRATQLILHGNESTTRRTWLIVDEVRELGNLDGLSRFLTMARSKGACFCGGYQTPSGMKDAVGDHVADEINDNIWHWALCRMGGDVSAEWASKLVGEVEFEETSGSSTSVVRRRAILPEYFMELPPPTPQTGVAGVFITPYTGAYTHSVPGSEIGAVRRLSRTDVPNFLPRPKSHQELPPWTDADYERVGFRPEQRPGDPASPAADDAPTGLRVVGRGNRNGAQP
jgi:type IV secretory pathway TraG/TraD family ATPase VirD4